MASTLCVLLTLALFGCSMAAPVAETTEATTTAVDEEVVPLYAVVEVIEEVPEVIGFIEAVTTEAPEEPTHEVSKRSLRGDNPSNDLLADLEGFNYDNGLSSLAGRRIKTLPSWLG